MKTIDICKGYSVTVDDEDVDLVSARPWIIRIQNDKPYVSVQRSKKEIGKRVSYWLHRDIANRIGLDGAVYHADGDTLNCRRENLTLKTSDFVGHARLRGHQVNSEVAYQIVRYYSQKGLYCTAEMIADRMGYRPYCKVTGNPTMVLFTIHGLMQRDLRLENTKYDAGDNFNPIPVYSVEVPDNVLRFPFGAIHRWRSQYLTDAGKQQYRLRRNISPVLRTEGLRDFSDCLGREGEL